MVSIATGVGPTEIAAAIRAASIRLIRNRRRGGAREAVPRGARVAGWILLGTSVLNVLFLVGTMLWGDLNTLFGVSLIYRLVLALPVLSTALTVAAGVYTALAWKDRFWGLAGRVHYTLVTVAAVAFVWFLNYWNLLGWRF